MNHNQQWLSLAMALLSGLIAIPAVAQSFNSHWNGNSNSLYRQQLNPIDRAGFDYIQQLGGQQDEGGYYQNPVPSQEAFGTRLPDGWHRAPMSWDDQGSSVLYYVKDGQILQQDYQLGGHH